MGKHDAGTVMYGHVGNDVTDRELGRILATVVPGKMQTPALFIHMCDPEGLTAGIGLRKACGEKGLGSGEISELR